MMVVSLMLYSLQVLGLHSGSSSGRLLGTLKQDIRRVQLLPEFRNSARKIDHSN